MSKLYQFMVTIQDKASATMDKLAGKSAEIQKKLDRAGVSGNNAGKQIAAGANTASVGVNSLYGSLVKVAGIMGVAFGVHQLIQLPKHVSDVADRVDKMSQKIGMSRSSFQEWDFVMSQSGMTAESLQMGMKSLIDKLGQAKAGAGTGADLFKRLGINITDSMSQEEAFNQTIRALQKMPEGIEKAYLANELFSRSSQELAPILGMSNKELDSQIALYKKLGIEMSDGVINAGVEYNDTLDRLRLSWQSIVVKVGGSVLPLFQQFADYTINTIIPGVKSLWMWLDENSTVLKSLALGITAAGAAWLVYNVYQKAAALYTRIMTIAQLGLNQAMRANPLGVVITLIGAATAGIAYLWETSEGFRGMLYGLWESAKQVFGNIANIIQKVATAWSQLTSGNFKAAAATIGSMEGLTNGVAEAFAKGQEKGISKLKSDETAANPFTDNTTTGGGAAPEDLQTGLDTVTGGGAKQTNINVTFGKLVGIENLNAATVDKGVNDMEVMITRSLLRILNSANNMATR